MINYPALFDLSSSAGKLSQRKAIFVQKKEIVNAESFLRQEKDYFMGSGPSMIPLPFTASTVK